MADDPPRERIGPRLRRTAGAQVIVLAVLLGLALLHFGTRSPASANLEGVVPPDAHLITQRPVGDVKALLIGRIGSFQLLMAYHTQDGWSAVTVPAPQRESDYAVATSERRGAIPAFTAVYGLVHGIVPMGAQVRVRWLDGALDTQPLAADGAVLAVREATVGVGRVSLVDTSGAVVRELVRYVP